MREGIQDLEAAFAEAALESAEVQADGVESTEPVLEAEDGRITEQAGDGAGDQPEVAETADDEIDPLEAAMLEDEAAEADGADTEGSVEVTPESTVTVDLGDGPTEVTIQDLVAGHLRQRDYTQKTQELAAMRSDLTDAKTFYDSFMSDPIEFTRALAVRAELLDPDTPVKGNESLKVQSAEEFEAAVQAEVAKRLETDPTMLQARQAAAVSEIHREFDRIGEVHGMKISDEVRQKIVDEAARRGTADLELVFEARLARAKSRVADKKGASTARPSASPATTPPGEEAPTVDTVEDAFNLALAEVG